MPKELLLQISPETAANQTLLREHLAGLLRTSPQEIAHITLLKRSIDARQKAIKINLKVDVFFRGEPIIEQPIKLPDYPNVSNAQEVIVVGAGPAGLFAALQLIELGLKPIVIERGKDVRGRRRDLKAINVDHIVDEDSNYCFGEGGAGTYSDGKLYTRSKKRGDVTRILELLVAFGASNEILIEAHPHIGTNKLPQIIQDIREKIIACGGQVLFETRVTDFILKNNEVQGVVTHNGDTIQANKIILATGHSARDIFELLHRKKIHIEAKPFALGVRAEHPQSLIDKIQYSCDFRGEFLPPSPYSIVKQVARWSPTAGRHPSATNLRPILGLWWSCDSKILSLLPSLARWQVWSFRKVLNKKLGIWLEKPKKSPRSAWSILHNTRSRPIFPKRRTCLAPLR